MCVAAGDDAKFWERRCADEALVGIDLELGGMIDGQQPNLIEVDGLFHRLHETEAEQAVAWANGARVNLQIFFGIRNVAFAGGYPVADYSGANHVGDEFVLVPVPSEQHGARTAAAIEFAEAVLFSSSEIDFVLRNSGWPEQADDFDILLRTETGEDRRGILSEVAGGALDFPFLVQWAGVKLDFCADSALVVVEGFEIETN